MGFSRHLLLNPRYYRLLPSDVAGYTSGGDVHLCGSRIKRYFFTCLIFMAHPTGFEPVTSAFGGQHSIQLSYGCAVAFDVKQSRSNPSDLSYQWGKIQLFVVYVNNLMGVICAEIVLAALCRRWPRMLLEQRRRGVVQ